MLIGIEQELHRLPSDETLGRQGRDTGRTVCISLRLQGVEAAERLIDEGKGGLRCVEKERVVVTTDKTVEGRQLRRCKAVGVPGRNMPILA